MYDSGLIEETRALVEAGREPALRALRAVGYDEALDLLSGRLDREEAEQRTNLRTRQLAKRQRTWFRHQIEAARLDAERLGEAGCRDAVLEALRA
jgi:tRNA dimethylallyltransferase